MSEDFAKLKAQKDRIVQRTATRAEKALRQLLDEAQVQLDFAQEHGQEKATAMLFAARTKEIALKGLGEKYDSGQ